MLIVRSTASDFRSGSSGEYNMSRPSHLIYIYYILDGSVKSSQFFFYSALSRDSRIELSEMKSSRTGFVQGY